jgi:glucuronate isomerase
MAQALTLHPDRLFPADPVRRAVARRLYDEIRTLPIVSPHGHIAPGLLAANAPFRDPASLLVIPDHYLLRMLYSQGVALESLGVPRRDGGPVETDMRTVWRRFASAYFLFRGTPSRMWLDYVLAEVFGVEHCLSAETADAIFDRICARLAEPDFRPRALFERFEIETLATTDAATDDLSDHKALHADGWTGRVIPTFRPDAVVDPETPGFADTVARLGELAGEDTATWPGYLRALAARRAAFIALGATASDHGHPGPRTADLGAFACESLFAKALRGELTPPEAEMFRAQMLTEMARMSLEDGLVLQIHAGAWRNHSPFLYERFGPDKGADIPMRTDYVQSLKPLLDRFGHEPGLTVVLFTLDETAYSRELAPLAGVYPALRLGPAWWFHDSPDGMRRYRRLTTETAGFYNTVGFNDDSRCLPAIPARHDVARRVDCAVLADLVCDHRLDEDEAREVAVDLTYRLPRRTYRLDRESGAA